MICSLNFKTHFHETFSQMYQSKYFHDPQTPDIYNRELDICEVHEIHALSRYEDYRNTQDCIYK